MSEKDKFGIIGLGVLAIGWLAGTFAADYSGSLPVALGVAFAVPTAIALVGATPISKAWWSANRDEAAKAGFGSEARTSLRFVALATFALAVFMGAFAFARESIYSAAFSGSLLALAAFAALRLRDLSARNFG